MANIENIRINGQTSSNIPRYIASWKNNKWSPLLSGITSYSGYINSLYQFNNNLIVGGSFSYVNGLPSNRIASWDGSEWLQLSSGVDNIVNVIYSYNQELIAGGWFLNADGNSCPYIAAWNGTNWYSLNNGMDGAVTSLFEYNGSLIVGGAFTTAGGVTCNGLAKWNGTRWFSLGTGTNNAILTATYYNGSYIAGGIFTTINGISCNKIASWDGTTWSALGSGMDVRVETLCVYQGKLIAGGRFITAGGVTCNYIAQWDGNSWSSLGGGMNGRVASLTVHNDELYAGGSFTVAGGIQCNRVAKWNGSVWKALSNGINDGVVLSLNTYQNQVITGGSFINIPDITPPRVSGLSPVVGWNLNTDPVTNYQLYYDIKIGTSNTNWGANNFVGDLVDDTEYLTATSSPLTIDGVISKAYKGDNPNSPSSLRVGAILSEADCELIQKIDGSYYTHTSTEYVLYDFDVSNFVNPRLVSCTARACPGPADTELHAFYIWNGTGWENIFDFLIPGVLETKTKSSWSSPLSNYIVANKISIVSTCSALSLSNDQGWIDYLSINISYTDTVQVPVESGENFFQYDGNALERGTTYYGQLRAGDDLTPWTLFYFNINQLPSAFNVNISPAIPTNTDNLEVNYTFYDQDDDIEYGTKIRWFKNNILQPDLNDLCTIPSSKLSVSDSWSVRITPNDGIEFGMVSESQTVTISESNSGINNIIILPESPNIDDILKVEYDLNQNEYEYSSIPQYSTLVEWYINDQLVSGTNGDYARLELVPGDKVKAGIKLTDGINIFAQSFSSTVVISDVQWYVYDLEVNGQKGNIFTSDINPYVEWKVQKTGAGQYDKPSYLRILVTKTSSRDGAVYDSGVIEYTNNSYTINSDVFQKGQNYYIHVGVSDSSEFSDSSYEFIKINIYGSSWNELVNNNSGWTVEFGLKLGSTTWPSSSEDSNAIIYIHDGLYFCSLTLYKRKVTLLSGYPVTYEFTDNISSLSSVKNFRISGKNNRIVVSMDETIIIDEDAILTSESKLKTIEYGDLDGNSINETVWSFFRYSTKGAFDIDNFTDHDTFYFDSIAKLDNGSVDYIFKDYISFLPDDSNLSSKIYLFDPTANPQKFATTTRNYSPITSIFIDQDRNKYIGTPNGINAIYGEKHDPDYEFITSENSEITGKDFDKISTVPTYLLSNVEPTLIDGWFSIDTTYRATGVTLTSQYRNAFQAGVLTIIPNCDIDENGNFINCYSEDEYGYIYNHQIHYYSQRVPGHSWYDKVDNNKGWQVGFSFRLDSLEQDNSDPYGDLSHLSGFGVYVNDGTYQEILYFYPDRIRLFYANVYVAINTTTARDYRISAKDKNIQIYQRLTNAPVGAWELIVDGKGMFSKQASRTGNSRKPKVAVDKNGYYHCVWHDDGNGRSQIFYSKFDGTYWSNPDLIADSYFNLRNPCLAIDSQNKVWVTFEDTSYGRTEISCCTKDDYGWNPKTRITNYKSDKFNPDISCDSLDNIHIVWEDNRDGNKEIFWAKWSNITKSWNSSSQFGEDESIVKSNPSDPYIEDAIEYLNPKLSFSYPYLWMSFTANNINKNESDIYLSFFNTENNQWVSRGYQYTTSNGDVINIGESIEISLPNRISKHSYIAANPSNNKIAIVWEDHTGENSQIWGATLDDTGTILNGPVQITNKSSDCLNPSIGFVGINGAVLFENENKILSNLWVDSFITGSAINGSDTVLYSGNKSWHPAISQYVVGKYSKICFDFSKSESTDVHDLEFPEFYLINSLDIYENSRIFNKINEHSVSSVDSKEFAFGDFSENVGMIANWKDIKMYFGYNARPQYITKYSSNNISNWPDNRINDIYVDKYGNIISATFKGLVYQNIYTGQTTNIDGSVFSRKDETCSSDTCILKDKIITSVKWGKNGVWFVGAYDGAYITFSAGQTWERIQSVPEGTIVNDISVTLDGKGIFATNNGVYVCNPFDPTSDIHIDTSSVNNFGTNIRTISIDENNIIWSGNDNGLLRIENYKSFLLFTKDNGLRTNYITSIAIVSKYVRYIGTVAGIHLMNGSKFTDINTSNLELNSNNISCIKWEPSTNSLWVGCLDKLIEIVFRDNSYNIIENEIVQYSTGEILTESSLHDKDTRYILDSTFESDVQLSNIKVFINKNKVNFGYSLNSGNSIKFLCDILDRDDVEIEYSTAFTLFNEFDQNSAEESVYGFKRRTITKIDETSNNKLVMLSGQDSNNLLMYSGDYNLPFDTIAIDREAPVGALAKTKILSKNKIGFRIVASDQLSGIKGYMLSNYENFTSDGSNPLDYSSLPSNGYVTHNISDDLTVVTNEFSITDGLGCAISKITNSSTNKTYLFAGTSFPSKIYKYDPDLDSWDLFGTLDSIHSGREITCMAEINNSIYITTGLSGGNGSVYIISDIDNFSTVPVMSVAAEYITSIAKGINGEIYFGDSNGNIHEYKAGIYSVKFSGVAQSINSLDCWNSTLLAATGNNGRIYSFNIDSGDSLIVFTGTEENIQNVFISNKSSTSDLSDIYASSGEYTNIYRGNLDDFTFYKSYSSYGSKIYKINEVPYSSLNSSSATGSPSNQVIAAIGTKLFKKNDYGWEYFYNHNENIKDFVYATTKGQDGIFVISESKITKWTNIINDKIVYLRLVDNAGNISTTPIVSPKCPTGSETSDPVYCLNYAYSININDLQNFVNESRIVDVDEYGAIQFSYDSPNDRLFYSADKIETEIGIYTSQVFNGSNDLVSWKSLRWESIEPNGTTISFQIRHAKSESDLEKSEWSDDLPNNTDKTVRIEYITDQYIQYRAILKSKTKDLSPSLSSVILRNITATSSHFFTTNFIMPSRPIKGLLTANSFIPVSADIVFGINTKNSTDFSDYQIIEPNKLFNISQSQFGSNLRIGAKLLSPSVKVLNTSEEDPYYNLGSYICSIIFDFTNNLSARNYHFRIKFYSDLYRTQLAYTFYSGNDQTGWSYSNDQIFPSSGLYLSNGETSQISFTPGDLVSKDQKLYITIEYYNGSDYVEISSNRSYVCQDCYLVHESGLISTYYNSGLPSLSTIPNFSSYNATYVSLENNIDFSESYGNWITTLGEELEGYDNNFAVKFKGLINSPISGYYTFSMASTDGSRLFIDGEEIIDHDGIHTFTSKNGEVYMSQGMHDIEIHYFKSSSGNHGLQLKWITPGNTTESTVSSEYFYHAVASEYCDIEVPKLFNFAVMFELENGESVKLNLS